MGRGSLTSFGQADLKCLNFRVLCHPLLWVLGLREVHRERRGLSTLSGPQVYRGLSFRKNSKLLELEYSDMLRICLGIFILSFIGHVDHIILFNAFIFSPFSSLV